MKNKNLKYIIISILAVLIVAGILVTIILVNKKAKNVEIPENSEVSDNNESEKIVNLNDMEKTENVEISGGEKRNISEKLLEERTFENLKIKNISLIAINGTTTFKATVENPTDTVYENKAITIIFKDNDGNECGRIGGLIEKINPQETGQIDASTSIDISNAYDFEIK